MFGITVSVLVDGRPIEPFGLAEQVFAEFDGIRIECTDIDLLFTADERSTLTRLAEPVAAWWQAQGPGAVLRFVSPTGGGSDTVCASPDFMVELVRHSLETESGPVAPPPAVPTTSPTRLVGGFTARVVGVSDQDGIVCAGAAEQPDGTGLSILLQGIDPESDNYDPDDDQGYCVVTDTAATHYGGISALRLDGRQLHIEFDPRAATELDLHPTVTIRLDVPEPEVGKLCAGLRRVFSYGSGPHPAPRVDLDARPGA